MPGKSRIEIVPANALFVYDKTQLKKVMRQAGQEVAAVAKAMIRSSTGGPGQPPMNRTGDLIRSIKARAIRSGEGVVVTAGAQSPQGFPYAVALEGGSEGGGPGNKRTGAHHVGQYQKHGSRVVAPRPFLSVALERRQDSLATRIKAAVVDGVAFKRVKP